MIWFLLYNGIVLPAGWLVFQILRAFDPKVRRGIRGRKDLFAKLEKRMAELDPGRRRVWFHSSSLGEFEQAKPIIAELKRRHPEIDVIVSFFSPSGFEHSQLYKQAAFITYLPFDSYSNAKRFIGKIHPSAAVMVRYDVWPNHLWAMRKSGIPTFIANATLRPHRIRQLPVIKQLHRAMYDALDYILTVSESDRKTFESYGLTHPQLSVAGDTRYDQVWQRSREAKSRHLIPSGILTNKKVVVVGSSWQEDEERLLPAFIQLIREEMELLVLLVPHEPNIETLEHIENELSGKARAIRFSDLADYSNEEFIVIDSVGILMTMYQYAHVAYVGGSFHQGVHNVLEPAAYGIPILFGPKHHNSQEASELLTQGAAFTGENAEDFHRLLNTLLSDDPGRTAAGKKALELVQKHTGATERFLSCLEKVL